MRTEFKKLRVVLDTNVLVSALGFQKRTKKIWDLVEERKFDLFLSPFILSEFEKCLIEKVGLAPEKARLLAQEAKLFAAKVVLPERKLYVIKDKESDNAILECAVDAKADIIVTGNMKHIKPLGIFQGIEILTPQEFLQKYFNESTIGMV